MRLILTLVAVSAAAVPTASAAQTVFRATPALTATQVYDSNVFYTPAADEADLITRITPALRTELASPRWTLDARYALDAERFAVRDQLSSPIARQQGLAAFDFRPSGRFRLTAGAEISGTKTPTELNATSGLSTVRAPAMRVAGRSAVRRDFSAISSGTLSYAFTDDRIDGGVGVRTHEAATRLDRRLTPRSAIGAGYRFQRFDFDGLRQMSHAVNVGWTHALARRTTLSIAGGPSLTAGSTGFDVAVAVRDRLDATERSVAYVRSQTTAVGLPGVIRTQSVTASLGWGVGRKLTLQLVPAVYRSEHDTLAADVIRLAMHATRSLTDALALEVGVGASLQRGDLYPGRQDQTIARQEVTVRLIAGAPTRSR